MVRLKRLFLALVRTPEGKTATAAVPILHTVRDFAIDRKVGVHGNACADDPALGVVCTVAVAEKRPAMVVAATQTTGLLLSEDGGATWKGLSRPPTAARPDRQPVVSWVDDPALQSGHAGAMGWRQVPVQDQAVATTWSCNAPSSEARSL